MRTKIKIEHTAGDVKHVILRLVTRIAPWKMTLEFLSHERKKSIKHEEFSLWSRVHYCIENSPQIL